MVANFHGYHLEHLCGLRKSSSERQKVANNYRTPELKSGTKLKYNPGETWNILR